MKFHTKRGTFMEETYNGTVRGTTDSDEALFLKHIPDEKDDYFHITNGTDNLSVGKKDVLILTQSNKDDESQKWKKQEHTFAGEFFLINLETMEKLRWDKINIEFNMSRKGSRFTEF